MKHVGNEIRKPRGRKRYLTYTLMDIYYFYKEERKDWSTLVPYTQWIRVAKRLLYLISKSMIEDNLVFRPPGNMGRIGIIKRKHTHNTARVNWKASNAAGKIIKFLDIGSGRYYFKYIWDKKHHCLLTNSGIYGFVADSGRTVTDIGRKGLYNYITKCKNNPYTRDFDCMEILT